MIVRILHTLWIRYILPKVAYEVVDFITSRYKKYATYKVTPKHKYEKTDIVTIYQAEVTWIIMDSSLYKMKNKEVMPAYLLKNGANYLVAPEDTLTIVKDVLGDVV